MLSYQGAGSARTVQHRPCPDTAGGAGVAACCNGMRGAGPKLCTRQPRHSGPAVLPHPQQPDSAAQVRCSAFASSIAWRPAHREMRRTHSSCAEQRYPNEHACGSPHETPGSAQPCSGCQPDAMLMSQAEPQGCTGPRRNNPPRARAARGARCDNVPYANFQLPAAVFVVMQVAGRQTSFINAGCAAPTNIER